MALLLHKWHSKAVSLLNYATHGHVPELIQLLHKRENLSTHEAYRHLVVCNRSSDPKKER